MRRTGSSAKVPRSGPTKSCRLPAMRTGRVAASRRSKDRVRGCEHDACRRGNDHHSSAQAYKQQFVDGKMIGGQMWFERDLVDYQERMRGRRLFVSNLDYETSWRQLKDLVRREADVARVDIFTHESGKSKGCGVVEFETRAGCKSALQTLNETELMGRKLFFKLVSRLCINMERVSLGYGLAPFAEHTAKQAHC